MTIRLGVTAQEEHKLKTLISKGTSWEEIVADGHLVDVDLPHVKKHIFDHFVKKLEEAKKSGFKDIHSYEAKTAKDRAAVAKKAKEEE